MIFLKIIHRNHNSLLYRCLRAIIHPHMIELLQIKKQFKKSYGKNIRYRKYGSRYNLINSTLSQWRSGV